jgi:hypothetical protein
MAALEIFHDLLALRVRPVEGRVHVKLSVRDNGNISEPPPTTSNPKNKKQSQSSEKGRGVKVFWFLEKGWEK